VVTDNDDGLQDTVVTMSTATALSLLFVTYKLLAGMRASRTRMELQFHPDPARKLSANHITYTIALCTVKYS
jgi:hypothetical protein